MTKNGFFKKLATTVLLLMGFPAAILIAPLLGILWAAAVYVAFLRALAGYAKSFRKAERADGPERRPSSPLPLSGAGLPGDALAKGRWLN